MTMRTTLDIPDDLFRRIKATAALKGQTMRTFFIEAASEKLRAESGADDSRAEPPWMRFVGRAPRGARQEIDAIVEKELAEVKPEDWR